MSSPLDQRPIVVALAAPNGAGKTTFFHQFLANRCGNGYGLVRALAYSGLDELVSHRIWKHSLKNKTLALPDS